MTLVDIINNLVFPIAMCVVFCYAIKYLYDSSNKREKELTTEYQKSLNRFNDSIKENTTVLTKVFELLNKNNKG